MSLPPTLVTEAATPATEAEVTFSLAGSPTDREYGLAASSLQYAPIPSFGLKLIVPFTIRESLAREPTGIAA